MIYDIDGLHLINCTPHEIRFQNANGDVVTVEPSGYTLKATPQEVDVTNEEARNAGITFVSTQFTGSEQGYSEIAGIRELFGNVLIIGSIISAQAFPSEVVSLVPVKGFERSAPADKLYYANKFNIFS
jgi:hypothetical protein